VTDHDLYVQTTEDEYAPADEKTDYIGLVPGAPVKHVWFTFTAYLELVGLTNRVDQLECCGCHRMVTTTDMHTVMPVDQNSLVCGAGYVFCGVCRLGEDPSHAYRHADIDFKKLRGNRSVTVDRQLNKPIGL